MAEFMNGMKRTDYCASFSESDVGKEITVMGWTDGRRDLGSLIFVDLRDRTGILQIVFDESVLDKAVFEKATTIRHEFVLAAKGTLRIRSSINENIPTGRIELLVSEFKILSEAETTPFEIEAETNVNEMLRLKYRYLDLRRAPLQQNLMMRAKIANAAREYLVKNGFLEIETPFLGKSTPEGARDYLVPSRVHQGTFYALPQSPQLYKQLLMISGFDRYFQITKCFRDEDLRANRQPEFTQIDLEMSFVEDENDVITMMEGLLAEVFMQAKGISLSLPLPRLTWQEAMDRFGSDKPDTRFGMELVNLSDLVAGCGFKVFTDAVANGGSVRAINAKGFSEKLSRKAIDALGEFVKTYRAKGLAWMNYSKEGIKSPIAKFFSEETLAAIYERTDFAEGDILFFVADTNKVVYDALGALRLHLAEKEGLIDESTYDLLWVTDFPLFEYSEEEQRLVAMHHPFTAPKTEDLPLLDTAPEKARAKAYDIVINGQEAGGGSIRIHSNAVQKKMFEKLGFDDQAIKEKFGFFVDAFRYGTPPHGGLAFGLDRLTMLLTGTQSIRDVIAFPKVQTAACIMTEAPGTVEQKQLDELALALQQIEEAE